MAAYVVVRVTIEGEGEPRIGGTWTTDDPDEAERLVGLLTAEALAQVMLTGGYPDGIHLLEPAQMEPAADAIALAMEEAAG